jgi:hypothetical protein
MVTRRFGQFGRGDAAGVEAERARLRLQTVQKSRSA